MKSKNIPMTVNKAGCGVISSRGGSGTGGRERKSSTSSTPGSSPGPRRKPTHLRQSSQPDVSMSCAVQRFKSQ